MSKNSEQTARVTLILNGQSANAQLRDLEAAARKVKSELSGMQPNSAKFKETAANYKKINDELMKTRVQAGLARSSWDKMKETITSTFIGTLGSNLAAAGLQKIVGYFADAYENAKKLSDQFADIRKTTGMTRLEVLALNRELGKINTRTSMSELREIAKVGGQFGVAKEQILGFVQAVDRTTIALGDEFGGGAEQVATEMSKLRNILQDIKSDDIGTDIGFISNAINALASAGVATGPVVADLANRIGGYGSQIGLTSGEILGMSATLQELGVTAERGGTAVVKILQKMLTNSGDFARIAGMELGEFEKLLNDDIYGAFVKVMEGSKKMGQSSTLLAGIIDSLGVEGAGASEVFAKLGSNTSMLKEKVDLASISLTNLNSITEESRLKNDNLAGSAERLGKNWNKLISSNLIQSFFKTIVDGANNALDSVNRMITSNEQQMQNRISEEGQLIKTKIAGIINGYKQMNLTTLQEEKKTLEEVHKVNLEYAKKGNILSDQTAFRVAFNSAKETNAQLSAIKIIITEKEKEAQKTLADKRLLTENEIKQEQKKQAEIKKIEEKAAEERLSFEQARLAYEYDEWKKKMYQQIEDMKTMDEIQASLMQDDADKLLKQLEYEQDLEKDFNDKKILADQELRDKRIAMAESFASSIESIGNSLLNRQYVIDRNELASDKKKNDQKRLLLKQRLDKGQISQQEYDKQIAAIAVAEEQREMEMQRKAAEREKKIALFNLSIRMLIAGARALGGNPAAIAEFIASGVAVGVVAATPIPEFYDGGYTPDMGSGVDGKGGFNAILHPNEYVINAKQMANPFVYNFTQQLENGTIGSKAETKNNINNQEEINVKIINAIEGLSSEISRLKVNDISAIIDWDYWRRSEKRIEELNTRRKL